MCPLQELGTAGPRPQVSWCDLDKGSLLTVLLLGAHSSSGPIAGPGCPQLIWPAESGTCQRKRLGSADHIVGTQCPKGWRMVEWGAGEGQRTAARIPNSTQSRGLLPQDQQCPLALTGQHRPSLLPPAPTHLSSGAWGRAPACMGITGRDLSQSVQPAAWLGQSDLLTPQTSEPHLSRPRPRPPNLGEL